MENKFLKTANREEWRNLLDRALFKTFFHSLEWEEFLERNFKWLKFERYVYGNSLLLSMARVGNKLISHPFCEYGGPLPLAQNLDYEQFKRDLFLEFKGPVKISFHPHLFNFFNASRTVLDTSERVSYFLEELQNIRKTTRQEIGKAQTNNLQIGKCREQKDLSVFYGLYLKSAKRHKIPAYPASFFDYFFHSPSAEIILAKKEGRVIAGSVFLFYGKFVHYFQNALDQRYKNLGANYLILQDQIQRCSESKRIFDFGGTRQGSPLQIFKQGWGGKECQIFELKNRYDGSDFRKSKLRDIYAFLPLFLIKKLSPYLLKYKL